jgi:hypothetical protein
MNAVEIEEAVSELFGQPFDPTNFAFNFLGAFGNKKVTIDRLRKGNTNSSDLDGGVLQRNNIHISVCNGGAVPETLEALRASPANAKGRVKFLLATDGVQLEAEDLNSGDIIACAFSEFPNKFAFFLPLAGIMAIKQIKENSFDIRATSRLNKLYVELLKDNPEWTSAERRQDMNHFMTRLIFCFFAEDTDIFRGKNLLTGTVNQMSARDSSNTHEVIGELFRAMDTPIKERATAGIRSWANDGFPYVNGGLFSGSRDVPRFSKLARSYLFNIGTLDWKQINPDIFGSMIQAVADEEERGALGMHYTSVPNILKVLNPLFLDDLHGQLEAAEDSPQKLFNLRKRMAKIRVFDPACGSGNFLVIAYKRMRAIEAEINDRRNEPDFRSVIPLTNFRGIELRDFSAEIARLALIIAEYQCDVLYRGQKEALAEFLPLDAQNWINCGNALRLDWFSVCPPMGKGVKTHGDDLFTTPLDQAEVDFENEGGETYICGNPPYLGSKWQSDEQKADLKEIFDGRVKNWKSLDYVSGWFMKAADYGVPTSASSAFVSTNSITQGQQVSILWPEIFKTEHRIFFAHTSFKWANLASHNAGVMVVIVGISNNVTGPFKLFSLNNEGQTIASTADNINAYLVRGKNIEVKPRSTPNDALANMQFGNHPYYGSALIFSKAEAEQVMADFPDAYQYIRPLYGSKEFISAAPRACLWITDDDLESARAISPISSRIEEVATARRNAKKDKAAQKLAQTPYKFREQKMAKKHVLVVPRVSSENRPVLPVGLLGPESVIQDQAFALYDAPIWNLSFIASKLHIVWIATVCGKLKTDFRYSNTLGWNTFPVPRLTEKNKEDLTRCAEDILLEREAHFPKTIADLYDPGKMPEKLREVHDRNDEVLERIYIGRQFKNDTERLEKLFDLYTILTVRDGLAKKGSRVP